MLTGATADPELPEGAVDSQDAELPAAHDGISKPEMAQEPSSTRRRAAWQRVLGSPYFRRGMQSSMGTAAIMALASLHPVFSALSLDPVRANTALILVGAAA